MTLRRLAFNASVAAVALLLAACAATPPAEFAARERTPQARSSGAVTGIPQPVPKPLTLAALAGEARIVDGDGALQCVTYARARTGIEIYGDAGTWWDAAAERYERSTRPRRGAVLVFRPTPKSVGHLAVVTRVVGNRLIVADHANWLNNGRIHEGTPIEDVSATGDWSEVRVWYTPGASWGITRYATFGFVLPEPVRLARRPAL